MLRRDSIRTWGSVASLLLSALWSCADVRVPHVFSDNMVLQRDQPIAVWGSAGEGEEITVRLNNSEAKTEARNGKWKVNLPKQKAGGPHELIVRGKNELRFQNVLVGEVWICSGQSNMEWPLRAAFEAEQAIEHSENPKIRLLTVPKLKANQPVDDIAGSWTECSASTVSNFSAVAYYFGRDLQKALNVPIGLIHTSWGGSPAEVWM
ncbi:MAG TPA: sialate O-acetylesterase, partial [Verrucomicrobiae bacterium]|nr:sialate O-acetylesterase [Verrucomicrobiae bacterium]